MADAAHPQPPDSPVIPPPPTGEPVRYFESTYYTKLVVYDVSRLRDEIRSRKLGMQP